MSITLKVSLLSGNTVEVRTHRDATVDDFKKSAQSMLSAGPARLVTASGHVLHGARTIGECDLNDSEAVTLHLQQPQILACQLSPSFAAIIGDGSVMTWGDHFGGDSSAVQEQLRNVQQIQASYYAFAAMLAHGSVVTWGPRWRQRCRTRPVEERAADPS